MTPRGRPRKLEGVLKVLTSATYEGLTGDCQKTNEKKWFLEAIVLVLLIFTGRTNIQKFKTGTFTGRLRDQVAGRPCDQMVKRF